MHRLVRLSPVQIICAGSCLDQVINNPILFKMVPKEFRADAIKTLILFQSLHAENEMLTQLQVQTHE